MARRKNRLQAGRPSSRPSPDQKVEDVPLDTNAHSGDSATGRISFVTLLASICGLATFLRLLNVLQTFEVPTLIELLGDAKGYFDWAVRISDGNWYGTETFYQAPLYPYFLAVLITIAGPSITMIRLVQMILGVLGVALMGFAGRKLFNDRVGLVSAFMLATYPPAIYYDGIIQKAAVATFLLCVVFASCVYLQREQRWWYAILTGSSLGLFVLARENALLWTPLIPVWMYFGLSGTRWKRLTLVGCYVAGLVLILLPIAARNASLGGEWSPTTFQAGPNFYIGNNLESNGIYIPLIPGHGTPMYERADAERLAEQAVGRELSSREVSKFWMSRAWEEIRRDPSRWIQLMIAKTFMVFNRYEVPDVESMYIFREYSAVLRLSHLWHFGILCPLGLWGVIATRKDWRELWLYYILLLTMIVAVVFFFLLGRYRNPIAILLIPFAAAGVVNILIRFKEQRWRSVSLAAVLLISGICCNIRVHEEDSLQASCYMNMGISACRAGNLPEGIELLQKSIKAFPEMAEGYVNLGRAFMLSRRPDRAAQCFEVALTLDPRLVDVHVMLGEAYEFTGRGPEAIEQYRRALEVDPADEQAAEGLGRVQ
ncbi:MAG: tetratricopeptide repeat protein [Planctomycetota bacterium]